MDIRKIENIIEKDFSGIVSINKNGKNIFCKSYGYSDIPNKIDNEIDTKFAIASGGKIFVAVAILKLIEDEKLSFNTTIGSILDFDLQEIDSKITIRQLLNHTSGIPDYFDEDIMEEYEELWVDYPNYKIRNSSDIIPLFINKPMMYPSGEEFKYNNTGYVVLGLIIEILTGVKFDEYIQKNIFEPCGMINTGYYELDRLPEKCANSYIYDKDKNDYKTNIYSVDVKGTGAGGTFITVSDLEKFWLALLSYKLISKESVDEMLYPQANNENETYGYGIWIKKGSDELYKYNIEGLDPGISFYSSLDREIGLIITLISNTQRNVWKQYREIIEVIS